MALTENTLNIKLLKTKYNKPGLNNNTIPRKAVWEKLDHSLDCKLTVVTAPAGYGKTTAVLEWLRDIPLPSGWVSLDAGDNDPLTFWQYCFAALETVCPVSSKEASYVFSSQELFRSNLHLNILLDSLSALQSDCLLILDDFHLITNAAILEAISHFISYLPTNMHIILTSRTSPPPETGKAWLS